MKLALLISMVAAGCLCGVFLKIFNSKKIPLKEVYHEYLVHSLNEILTIMVNSKPVSEAIFLSGASWAHYTSRSTSTRKEGVEMQEAGNEFEFFETIW